MTAPVTLGAGYFDAMYRDAADPWGFEDRWYERRKYAISLALFPAGRYGVADYPRSGDDVHRVLAARPGLARLVRHTEPDFLAEIYIRTDGVPVSVAQATGLA